MQSWSTGGEVGWDTFEGTVLIIVILSSSVDCGGERRMNLEKVTACAGLLFLLQKCLSKYQPRAGSAVRLEGLKRDTEWAKW